MWSDEIIIIVILIVTAIVIDRRSDHRSKQTNKPQVHLFTNNKHWWSTSNAMIVDFRNIGIAPCV